MFHTNEPVDSTFTTVSLRVLVSVWFAANMTYGGSNVRLLNWLSLVSSSLTLGGGRVPVRSQIILAFDGASRNPPYRSRHHT